MILLLAVLLAGSVTDEIAVQRGQVTQGNPRAGSVSDSLNATFDLSDAWSFNAGALVTLEGQTPAAEQGAFGTSASAVALLTAGLDWEVTEHFALGLDLSLSPSSQQNVGTALTVSTAAGDTSANALIKAVGSEGAAGVNLTWDTGGDTDLEWMLDAGVTLTHFSSDQDVEKVRGARGVTLTPQQALNYCNTHKCPAALVKILMATIKGGTQSANLDSAKLSLAATATAWRDTDFTLGADFYGYSEDPTQVGFFSLSYTGRGSIGGGSGIPIAPLRTMIRPEVLHRFGDFSLKLWVQAGQYVESTGQSTTGGGVKAVYKFSKTFRMWLTLSGQQDVDDTGVASKSGAVALGAGYRF